MKLVGMSCFNFAGAIFIEFEFRLLTKRAIKVAGYWLSSFFIVFNDRDRVEVHNQANETRGQYPAILNEQAWLIKDLLCGKRALWDTAGDPEHAR